MEEPLEWVRPVVRQKRVGGEQARDGGASGAAAPGSRLHGTSKWTEKQIGFKKISNFCG